MCGITAIWHRDGRPTSLEELDRFTDSIAHRGPDGRGTWISPSSGIGLGHRRLAILDPTPSGAQPMRSSDGRHTIVYNGEVFNFLELRRDLERRGHTFRTETDTEVILAAHREWGPDAQLRMNGMWAFAIWDEVERSLFVSRDRFGIKPCLIGRFGKAIYIASELRAFKATDRRVRVNDEALQRELLSPSLNEGIGETLLADVTSLKGGHCALITEGGETQWQWWETLEHLPEVPAGLDEQADMMRELLIDSCRLRLRSDVPVATSLSGGLDSSSVLAGLRAAATSSDDPPRQADWQHAFIASFPGTAVDEDHFALAAAKAVGARPELVALDLDQLTDRMQELMLACEVVIPTFIGPVWAIYNAMAQRSIKVSLDGHGGDEMLAGYWPYVTTALSQSKGLSRGKRRELVETMLRMQSLQEPGRRARLKGLATTDPRLRSTLLRARDHVRWRLGRHGSGGWTRGPAVDTSVPTLPGDDLEPVSAHLYRDFHVTSLPAILRNFDRASMANGVEVRMPLMDWRLVTMAFALPDESKIGGGFSKRVLREAVRPLLPAEVVDRRWKVGFSSPLADWFSGPLQTWVRDLVRQPDFLASDVWDGPLIKREVDAIAAGGTWTPDQAGRVWLFASAHMWQQSLA